MVVFSWFLRGGFGVDFRKMVVVFFEKGNVGEVHQNLLTNIMT
jgi:hypothetical protein